MASAESSLPDDAFYAAVFGAGAEFDDDFFAGGGMHRDDDAFPSLDRRLHSSHAVSAESASSRGARGSRGQRGGGGINSGSGSSSIGGGRDARNRGVPPRSASSSAAAGDEFEIRDFSYEALLALDETVEKIGFSAAQIARLPRMRIAAVCVDGEATSASSDSTDCAVCLSPYEIGDEVTVLPCFCKFHRACIEPWLKHNKTCPRDRTRIPID